MPHILLLADDSPTIQRVIQLTFAEEDVQVVTVGDGDQAIERIDAHPPDIVLADVAMPGKNGYEVARYIKHSPRLSHIPVLLLTGAFEPVDQRQAAEAGCDGVLAKPFEPQLVIGRVKELLHRPRGEAAPPASALASPPPPLPAALAPAPPAQSSVSAGEEEPRDGEPGSSPLDDFIDQLEGAISKLVGSRDGELPAPAPSPPPASPQSTKPTRAALAEAFAALLAAEGNTSSSRDVAAGTSGPLVTNDLVDRVADRVLERLSDRVVRETVADLVSSTAERLVREEIARLKASIK